MSFIEAEIPYLATMREKPVSYTGHPQLENLKIDWRTVSIHDASGLPNGPDLKQSGFTKVSHLTRIEKFDLTTDWHSQFVAEVSDILKRATGASEIVIPAASLDYRKVDMPGSFGPALWCHNDFTAGSAARHIVRIDPAKAEQRLSRRFAVYNVWRLVSPPPQTMPLALCDARSVSSRDLVPTDAVYGDPENPITWGEVAAFHYNPNHNWFYFPKLTPDEVLIWCGFDSDPAYASIVPHTAFTDATCPQGTGPRTNIDARCFAFFAD